MTDQEIIQGLIERNNRVTTEFFFKDCRPLFCSIINYVFDYEVDYDEFVNELYMYLMENDAQKLRNFQFRSSVYMWLKILAIRYFIKKRAFMIDDSSQETPYDGRDQKAATESDMTAGGDLERLFMAMSNQRYVCVLRKLVIEDMEPEQLAKEMGTTTANLYNIKKRAMAQLTRVALNDSKEYGKKRLYIR
ncbi:MAG: sigma-70 family RNA polymerase sigma factor [Prevotella sp.]|nr:sigma-70 family RNA polymerase sigma factor [Prevotella sp.]